MIILMDAFSSTSKKNGKPFTHVDLMEVWKTSTGRIMTKQDGFFVSGVDISGLVCGDIVEVSFAQTRIGSTPELVAIEKTGVNVFASNL